MVGAERVSERVRGQAQDVITGGCCNRTHETLPCLTDCSINELKAFRLMIWIPVMRRVFPTNGDMALSTHSAGSLEAFTLKVIEAFSRSAGVPTEAERAGRRVV